MTDRLTLAAFTSAIIFEKNWVDYNTAGSCILNASKTAEQGPAYWLRSIILESNFRKRCHIENLILETNVI